MNSLFVPLSFYIYKTNKFEKIIFENYIILYVLFYEFKIT